MGLGFFETFELVKIKFDLKVCVRFCVLLRITDLQEMPENGQK
jgi:hypothetical protein